MANTLTNVTDKILARGLMVLREAAIMPRLVNVDYQGDATRFGTTIDVPVPVPQAVSTVAAAAANKAAASKTPLLVQIPMNQWKMTDFHLTDKEMAEVDRNRHFLPGQTEEAARALANTIDTHIYNQYKTIFGYVGTASVTPFSTLATTTNARKVLNEQLSPMSNRRVIVDPTAEAQMLLLAAYRDVSQSSDRGPIIEGEIGHKMGMDHFMSQNIVTHTAGTVASAAIGSTTAAGASVLAIKAAASATVGTILFGDIFTIAGQTTTYVYKSSTTITLVSALTAQNINIAPVLSAIATADAAVQFKRTHVVNLAFNRNAFAYVTRPLDDQGSALLGGNLVRSMTDDISGVTLRLEVVRQHKQVAWQFDVLYGAKLVRPELATRVAG